jgi:hypothetical protein
LQSGCTLAVRAGRALLLPLLLQTKRHQPHLAMAGLGNNPVQVFRTLRDLHWEFLRLWTDFELSSSCVVVPGYASNLNRNILDFMRWPQIDRGAQDINDIQRPKSFFKNSWK